VGRKCQADAAAAAVQDGRGLYGACNATNLDGRCSDAGLKVTSKGARRLTRVAQQRRPHEYCVESSHGVLLLLLFLWLLLKRSCGSFLALGLGGVGVVHLAQAAQ
jgi:hypothetical protein